MYNKEMLFYVINSIVFCFLMIRFCFNLVTVQRSIKSKIGMIIKRRAGLSGSLALKPNLKDFLGYSGLI